jgi:putative ABC transport system permease protein
MDQQAYDQIRTDPRIDKITPQLVATVFDPDRQEGAGGIVMFMGIQESYLDLKPWVKFKSGAWFSAPDADEVIMGYEAAELEQRNVGDEVFIPGKDKILKVVGIFERTGTQDDGVLFLPLQTTQTIFDLPEKLTGVGIKLKDIQTISKVEEDLYEVPNVQVISMAQVRGTILNLIASAKIMANSIAVIAIFIAVIGVVNTILMSVFERTQEIGVLKAIGASRLGVFRLIWIETVLICAAGGIFGNIFALASSHAMEMLIKSILPYAPSGPLVVIEPVLLFNTLIGAVVLGLVSGLYPAWRACAMVPVEAIRRGE